MEHVISAPASGVVTQLTVEPGDTVYEGHVLVLVEESDVADGARRWGRRDRPRPRPPRPRRGPRPPPDHAGRGAPRRRRQASPHRPAHGAGEHRRPVRRGVVRRARPARPHARHRAATRGGDPQVPDRRDDHRDRGDQRRAVSDARRPLRRDGLRLHGARRHPGRGEPPEDRPDAATRREVAAARSCCSPRAAAAAPARAASATAARRPPVPVRDAPRTATVRSTRRRSRRWPGCRASCPSSASPRASASPATRRCSDAAT